MSAAITEREAMIKYLIYPLQLVLFVAGCSSTSHADENLTSLKALAKQHAPCAVNKLDFNNIDGLYKLSDIDRGIVIITAYEKCGMILKSISNVEGYAIGVIFNEYLTEAYIKNYRQDKKQMLDKFLK